MFGVSFSVQGRGAIHNYHIDMTTNISDIGINDFSLIKWFSKMTEILWVLVALLKCLYCDFPWLLKYVSRNNEVEVLWWRYDTMGIHITENMEHIYTDMGHRILQSNCVFFQIHDFPEKLNFYVMGNVSFYKSSWPEIRSNAAMFTGFLLGNIAPQGYTTISKEHVCGGR